MYILHDVNKFWKIRFTPPAWVQKMLSPSIASGRSKKLRIWLSWSKFFGFSTYLNRLSCKPWIKDSVLLDLLNFPKFYSNFLSFTPTFLSFTPTFLSFTPTFLSFTPTFPSETFEGLKLHINAGVNILGKNLGRSKDKFFCTHAWGQYHHIWLISFERYEPLAHIV